MELHHKACSALENDKNLGIVVLDLRKAFDSLPHPIILHKLENYGVRGTPLKLFKSYFQNRIQQVKVGDSRSNWLTINRGIAQGSNIAPTLFNIGMNDFKDLQLNAHTKIRYADDTILLYEFSDGNQFEEKVREDMKTLVEYFRINGMALNINKSSFLVFHKKKSLRIPSKIQVDANNTLSRVSSCRYLGVEFDEHLTFQNHIEILRKKLISTVNLLRKLKWHLPTFVLRSIYFAHFHSHLHYIPFVWGFASESLLKPLQTLQNRALKHVYKLPMRYNTENLFNGPANRILPVKGIIAQFTINFIHKSLTNNIRTNIKFNLNRNNTKQNGQISRACGKPPSTNFGKRDIMHIAPILYNKLPKEVRESRFGQFKIKFKKILETNPTQLLNLAQFSLFSIKI